MRDDAGCEKMRCFIPVLQIYENLYVCMLCRPRTCLTLVLMAKDLNYFA